MTTEAQQLRNNGVDAAGIANFKQTQGHVLGEASGINDAISAVNNVMSGDFKGAAVNVMMAVTKPLKVSSKLTNVYRSASGTPASMTPRPQDLNGLSASNSLENAMPDKNQIIDISKLKNLCAVCDNTKTGHVSITPNDTSQMQGWIDSRGSANVPPLTQELMNAIVDTVKK